MTIEAVSRDRHSSLVPTGDRPGAHTLVPALVSAFAVLATGASVLVFSDEGPLATHMAVHIAVMNVLAPISAAAFWLARPLDGRPRILPALLWPATIAQMALLWASHVPAVQTAAAASLAMQCVLHGLLLAAAIAFWTLVLHPASAAWQPVLALLITAKLACLLGSLLIFAPRLLYAAAAAPHAANSIHHHATGLSTLADQQLAGLFMVAACPLSYVLAGVILAAHTITALARPPVTPRDRGPATAR